MVRRAELDLKRVIGADQILVGRNATRRAYNVALHRGYARRQAAVRGGVMDCTKGLAGESARQQRGETVKRIELVPGRKRVVSSLEVGSSWPC